LPAVIWLLRHAEAEEGSPDFERKLTVEGEQDARAAGAALAVLGLTFDACLASPRVRAWDTARLACESLPIDPIETEALQGGPFDPFELAIGYGDSVLMVGHEPDLSMAVHNMTGAQVRMPKSGVVAIDRGELNALLRPAHLRALARLR
jgi:phosphohistidine phosphatase